MNQINPGDSVIIADPKSIYSGCPGQVLSVHHYPYHNTVIVRAEVSMGLFKKWFNVDYLKKKKHETIFVR